jgi:hypothetical protein
LQFCYFIASVKDECEVPVVVVDPRDFSGVQPTANVEPHLCFHLIADSP